VANPPPSALPTYKQKHRRFRRCKHHGNGGIFLCPTLRLGCGGTWSFSTRFVGIDVPDDPLRTIIANETGGYGIRPYGERTVHAHLVGRGLAPAVKTAHNQQYGGSKPPPYDDIYLYLLCNQTNHTTTKRADNIRPYKQAKISLQKHHIIHIKLSKNGI